VPSPLGRLLRQPGVPFSVLADPPFAVIEDRDAARAIVAAARVGLAEPVNVVAPGAITALQAAVAALAYGGGVCLYAAVAQSEALNLAVETLVVRKCTIPASLLAVGDIVEIRDCWDTATNPALETLTYRHRIGGLTGDILAEDSGTPFQPRTHLTRLVVRTIGAAGSGSAIGGVESRGSIDPAVDHRLVSFDTTMPIDIVSSYVWTTIVNAPSVRLEQWSVWLYRPQALDVPVMVARDGPLELRTDSSVRGPLVGFDVGNKAHRHGLFAVKLHQHPQIVHVRDLERHARLVFVGPVVLFDAAFQFWFGFSVDWPDLRGVAGRNVKGEFDFRCHLVFRSM
jgi:hypothetical protein